MKKLLLLILIFQLSLASFGQTDSTKVLVKEAELIAKIENKPQITELDYYKLLAEQKEKDNETFISLTQWTLGISFASLLAIIGSQIFFNYRINKNEIDYII